jgi:hypothetical protein
MAEAASLLRKIGEEKYETGQESMGIFLILGFLVFAMVALAVVGLIFYRQSLQNQIEETKAESRRLEAEFSKDTIKEWARLAESIQIAKNVLDQHKYISNTFSFFEKNILPDVHFSSFSYDSSLTKVTVNAHAKNFTALAQQKEIFERDPAIERLGIGGFSLTPTGGVDYEMDLIFKSPILLSNE